MVRNQIWVYLVLGVAMGFVVEALKHAAPKDARFERLSRLEALMDEGQPAYQPFKISVKSKPVVPRSVHDHEMIAGLEASKPTDKPEVKATAEKKPAAKKDDKKKKKKKKKKEVKDEVKNATPTTPITDDDKKKKDDSMGGGLDDAPVTYSGTGAVDTPHDPQTAQEWEAYLLNSPSYDKTMKFVHAYQDALVTSDIYYTVAEVMAVDARPLVRDFAVVALGSTPSLRSFSYLIAINSTETDQKTKADSSAYLNAYTHLDNLHVLNTVLAATTEDSNTILHALQLTNTAITSYNKKQTGGQGGGGQTKPPQYVLKFFTPFETILKKLATSGDQSVRGTAANVLSSLDAFIGEQQTNT